MPAGFGSSADMCVRRDEEAVREPGRGQYEALEREDAGRVDATTFLQETLHLWKPQQRCVRPAISVDRFGYLSSVSPFSVAIRDISDDTVLPSNLNYWAQKLGHLIDVRAQLMPACQHVLRYRAKAFGDSSHGHGVDGDRGSEARVDSVLESFVFCWPLVQY